MSWPTGDHAGEPDPLDAPITLRLLVPRDELDELVAGVDKVTGATTAVLDTTGEVLAGAGAGAAAAVDGAARAAIVHQGTVVGWAVADADHADAAAHLAGVIGLLVHHAHAREL